MAAEAGARLSGMEFSSCYTLAPAYSTMTRPMMYLFGSYFDADGNELAPGFGAGFPGPLAKAMVHGPVFTRLDKAPKDIRQRIHLVQPNFRLPFDRRGIDPFTDLFEVTLHGEGTIRGVGENRGRGHRLPHRRARPVRRRRCREPRERRRRGVGWRRTQLGVGGFVGDVGGASGRTAGAVGRC
jgi:hypothetical protein